MFGTNFVTTFDYEFVYGTGALSVLSEIGITSLRFPGGTVTEMQFADISFVTGNWDADTYKDSNGNVEKLTTLNDFFKSAAAIAADVQLVIPTRVAFEKSAGQALRDGSYGKRAELNDYYFDWVESYVEEALAESASTGAKIERFEIGNEFWGSGQMTAAEYGFIAAEVTSYLGKEYPNIQVVVQVVASANEYSPLNSRTVYLEAIEGGDYIVHREQNTNSIEGGYWIPATMPGQGNVNTQVTAIADQFINNQDALASLDGILDHVYFDGGFAEIDGQRDFALNYPYNIFSEATGRGDLEYYVTEWSPRNAASASKNLDTADAAGIGNANGVLLAHTTVESFFELASNGVDGANFWPLTFGNPNVDSRVLVDTSELDLTYSGVAFQLLSNSVVGLQPVLDFEIDNQIDVHGFENDSKLVLFVGDRSGESIGGNQVNLELGGFSPSYRYFINVTTLNSDDGTFDNVNSNPIIEFSDGYVQTGETILLDLKPWDLSRVELQAITNKSDRIVGREGNDRINGLGGNDTIAGGGGSDNLNGGDGFDTVIFDGTKSNFEITQSRANPATWFVNIGEEVNTLKNIEVIRFTDGNFYLSNRNYLSREVSGTSSGETLFGNSDSELINGSGGDDTIAGNAGDDILHGGFGGDRIFGGNGLDLIDGGRGNDRISGGNGRDIIFGSAGADSIYGGVGADSIYGGIGNDRIIAGAYRDLVHGGDGNDLVWGNKGNDILHGGSGNDKIVGGIGHDRISGGNGRDIISGSAGADSIYGGVGADSIYGGAGNDVLDGGAGNDIMVGGSGGDRFIFSSGGDRIKDFDPKFDKLILESDLWEGLKSSNQVLNQFGSIEIGNLVLDFGEGNQLTLYGISNMVEIGGQIEFI